MNFAPTLRDLGQMSGSLSGQLSAAPPHESSQYCNAQQRCSFGVMRGHHNKHCSVQQNIHPAFPLFFAGWIRAARLRIPSRTPQLIKPSRRFGFWSSGGFPAQNGHPIPGAREVSAHIVFSLKLCRGYGLGIFSRGLGRTSFISTSRVLHG